MWRGIDNVNRFSESMNTRKIIKLFKTGTQTDESWPLWLRWMCRPTGDQEVAGSTPAEVGNILLWRLTMKYFPLIQEGQLSVSGKRMCTILVNSLED